MKAKFCVDLKAEVGKRWDVARMEYRPTVKEIKAVNMTQGLPTTRRGDLLVEFELEVPDELLLPLLVSVELSGVQAVIHDLKVTVAELRP